MDGVGNEFFNIILVQISYNHTHQLADFLLVQLGENWKSDLELSKAYQAQNWTKFL